MIVKLIAPLPTQEKVLDEISIQKQVLSTQEQEVFYVSAVEPPAVIRGLDYDEGMIEEIGDVEFKREQYQNYKFSH